MTNKLISIFIVFFGLSPVSHGFMPPWKARQNVWKKLSNTGAPSSTITQQRVAHLGKKVYLWGGMIGSTAISNGYIFDFATNSWSAMPTTGSPPSARYGHEMVVAGTRIYVWGGQTGAATSTRVNSGSYFDTATNTWTAMSSVGAPSGRNFMALVSTGTKIVVWGGAGTTGAVLGDGKVYDITTDTWTAVATASAPSARTFLTANKVVWTGSKVFIWGGAVGGTACANTGGLYDPSANTWQSIPTAGAPSARCFNSATWTGSKIIVWGGDTNAGGNAVINTGGIYDPALNTWVGSTTAVGAPAARHWHAGIWTPAGMVIWGGVTASAVTNTGKIYDPDHDRWSDMSNVNSTSGDSTDAKMASMGHFLFDFDGSQVRAFFP